jgi:hypothetical protein
MLLAAMLPFASLVIEIAIAMGIAQGAETDGIHMAAEGICMVVILILGGDGMIPTVMTP